MSEFEYKPGYEPSAPPFSSYWDYNLGNGRGAVGRAPHSGPGTRTANGRIDPASISPDETVGGYLLGVFGRMLYSVWSTSHTVARVDLKRPLRYSPFLHSETVSRRRNGALDPGIIDERDSEWDGPRNHRGAQRHRPPSWQQQRESVVAGGGRGNDYYESRYYPDTVPFDRRVDGDEREEMIRHGVGWRDRLRRTGARLKLMQVWDFPDKKTGEPLLPGGLNIGMGADFDLDTQRIDSRLRVRARHVVLRIAPKPELELRGKWALGATNLAVDVRYVVPVASIGHFWESPARLSVNLFNPVGTGIHLTPNGVEFDEHVLRLGHDTRLRLAATLQFPRRFPLEDGEDPFHLYVRRLGIRTRLM